MMCDFLVVFSVYHDLPVNGRGLYSGHLWIIASGCRLELACKHWWLNLHLHNHCKNEIRSARGQIIGIVCSIWTRINITHSRYTPMQYILVKGDVIEVNTFAIQLFHRVQCIWLKSQIKAVAFIQGQYLWVNYDCICIPERWHLYITYVSDVTGKY